jgi:hypothetical protein
MKSKNIKKPKLSKHDKSTKSKIFGIAVWSIAGLAVLFGVLMRVWYLSHSVINSDEAVAGLMAHAALHGHFVAFFWGNTGYGGSAEPYFAAGLFAIFGQSALVLKLTPILLAAIAAFLTYRIALRLIVDQKLAALAGAMVWASPTIGVAQSVLEGGFRGVTMACGLALILIALRALDNRESIYEFAIFGLLAGIGWWSSPEIMYFLLPSIFILVGVVARHFSKKELGYYVKRVPCLILGFLIGSLPWIWANVNSHLLSLKSSVFSVPPNSPDYVGRLHLFFKYTVPMLTSLRLLGPTAQWIYARKLSIFFMAVIAVTLVCSALVAIKRGGRYLAILAAVVMFPFIYAYSPGTWYWYDGRYSVYATPLAILLLVVGVKGITDLVSSRMLKKRYLSKYMAQLLMSFAVVVAIVFEISNFYVASGNSLSPYFHGNLRDPNDASLQEVTQLEKDGVHFGYADYWVAYHLDFLSHERLTLTGYDIERSPSIEATVEQASQQAYLFVKPNNLVDQAQFGVAPGLNGHSEQELVTMLQQQNIAYRIVNTKLLGVVIVTGSKQTISL